MKQGISNREAIASVLHRLAELGPISDETSYSKREIYFLLLRFRAAILAQKIKDRNSTINRNTYQTINCIALEDSQIHENPSIPEHGKEYKKTKYKIPKFIGQLTSVVSVGNNITYDYISPNGIQDLKTSRFAAEKNKAYYTIINSGTDGSYIFVYNDKHGDAISITGVFENPLEIQNFWDCDGKQNPCFSPLEQEFIIDPELLPIAIDMLLNSKFKYRPQSQDINNNAIDDHQNMRPPIK